MKKKSINLILIATFLTVSIFAVGNENPTKSTTMPDNVKAVIEKSCFGCHNTASKNEDGKEALDFKKFDELSMIKKISAYTNIGETVENEDMPPKKFLEKNPDKKLSDQEKKLLMDWSKKEAENLVKSK